MKIVFRLGKTIPLTENLDVGEPIYDADTNALGVGAGEQNARYYPGVRIDGSMKLNGSKIFFPYSDQSYLSFGSDAFRIFYQGADAFDVSNLGINLNFPAKFTGKATFAGDISGQGLSTAGNVTTFSGPVQFLGGINLSLASFASNILPTPYNPGDILVAGTPHTWKSPTVVFSTLGVVKQIADMSRREKLYLSFEDRVMFTKSQTLLTATANTSLDTLITNAPFVFTRGSVAYHWNRQGILTQVAANKTRIDHDPYTGECLGLLIEGPSQNLLAKTNGSDWTAVGGSSNANTARLSWSGIGLDAPTQVLESSGAGPHGLTINYVSQDLTLNKTYSTFIELDAAAPNKKVLLQITDSTGTNGFGSFIDFGNRVVDAPVAIGNGFFQYAEIKPITDTIYRICVTGVVNPVGSSSAAIKLSVLEGRTSDNNTTFTGTGANLWYVGNMMLENYYKMTSYVPALVQRAAENFTINGSMFDINDKAGTLKVTFSSSFLRTGTPIAVLDNGAAGNNITIATDTSVASSIAYSINAASVNTFAGVVPGAFTAKTPLETLFEYKPNSMVRYTTNGSAVTSRGAIGSPTSLSVLRIGSTIDQNKFLDGWITAISYTDEIYRYKSSAGGTVVNNYYSTGSSSGTGSTSGSTSANTDGGQF